MSARTGALLAWLCAAPLAAQQRSSLDISTEPAAVVRGTLARLIVQGVSPLALLGGEAAGEPLHFAQTDAGALVALIAAPFDDADSLQVTLVRTDSAGPPDTIPVALPVARGAYRTERLRVAERFVEPDSASAARIREEIAAARAVSRRAHDTPRHWTAPFRRPRRTPITSGYGTAREFNGMVQSRHLGTDFAGAVGAPVRAANAGLVALVADFYLAGTVVYLDHGEGLMTGYFHLSRAEVTPGEIVRAGQLIGRVGRSGRVTGPHLHWIARYGVITVDPMSLPTAHGSLP